MSQYYCRNCGTELKYNLLYCTNACQEQHRKSGYGHETLQQVIARRDSERKERYGNKKLRVCKHCNKTHFRNADYCSNACKQTAYRRRKDPESGHWSRKSERAQKAVRTKQSTYIKLVCEYCGDERSWSIASGTNRRYCSAKCKQAAYRKRNALLAHDVTPSLKGELRARNVTGKLEQS